MIYEDRKVNIFQGLVVKNYKEMCRLLGENIEAGNSKKAQIKNWQRYFSFEKDGQKYIVTEVYAEPFPSDDARKRKKGIYTKYIECLLIDALTSQSSSGEIVVTKKKLLQMLGMVNERYHQYFNNRPELVEIINDLYKKEQENDNSKCAIEITLNDVNQFYIHAGFKLNDILMSALDSMQRRSMILYRQHFMIRYRIESDNKKYEELECIATSEEERIILAIQHEAMRSVNCSTMVEVIFRNQYVNYQKKCDDLVRQRVEDWKYFYPVYHIVYMENLEKQIPLQIEELKRLTAAETKHELNDKVVKAIDDNSQKIYKKNREKIKEYEAERDKLYGKFGEWGDPNPMNHDRPYELSSDYVETQGNLNGYLVKL